jgi:hypothetical protein
MAVVRCQDHVPKDVHTWGISAYPSSAPLLELKAPRRNTEGGVGKPFGGMALLEMNPLLGISLQSGILASH